VVIVDEVSMVRADLIDGMSAILRRYRNPDLPFGGVQMIFIGDLYQLPPVAENKKNIKPVTLKSGTVFEKTIKEYFEEVYNGPYFFCAETIRRMDDLAYCELKKIFRQKDDAFINILNLLREYNTDQAALSKLNERFIGPSENLLDDIRITLCPKRARMLDINRKKLKKLETQEVSYEAETTGIFSPSPEDIANKDIKKKKEYEAPVEKTLILKEKAQIIMVKNDPDKRWVNGSTGIIKRLTMDSVEVEINGCTYNVESELRELKSKVIGTIRQYPVKLAWAITIHKSQGQTFDKVTIDLKDHTFAPGQLYVALSRCTRLEGIIITEKRITPYDIKEDPRIIAFERKMKEHAAGV
jgi:ATP-dependent exoDNAse (exonuclease V) alpha subunit